MASTFFNSWALWAKMSFVLALAIVAVFAIGYGKLLWMNRFVKREESKDEEERIKIEELRQSEQMIESRKNQDVPFGVRAIQSGIQVDGIWQSKGSTPIPASLKVGHTSRSWSGSQSPSPRASTDTSQAPQMASSRGRSSYRPSELGSLYLGIPGADDIKPGESQDTRDYRPSYKPRRSSHLRYGSHGEASYNEDTLDQLEGKVVPIQERSHGAGETYERETEGDASSGAIDTERSSGSEKDLTLSNNIITRQRFQRRSLPVQHSDKKYLSEPMKNPLSRSPRASLPSQSSNKEYFSIPLEPPKHQESNQLVSTLSSTMEAALPPKPPYTQTARELTASGESQVPLLSMSRASSPFIPGELHMNKTVRKVNSGFEVLPAGTFGMPINYKGQGVEREDRCNQDDDLEEKRSSNKLQKKIRTSVSSRRPSSTFESP